MRIGRREEKKDRTSRSLAALILTALITCAGVDSRSVSAGENPPPPEYGKVLDLINSEQWRAASDAADSLLKQMSSSADDSLKARLRYITLIATAGAVSSGDADVSLLERRCGGFVGQRIVLPFHPVASCEFGFNMICLPTSSSTTLLIAASDKSGTSVHAFEYITLKEPAPWESHRGEWASVSGVLTKISPTKSRAIVMRVYIDQAEVLFRAGLS